MGPWGAIKLITAATPYRKAYRLVQDIRCAEARLHIDGAAAARLAHISRNSRIRLFAARRYREAHFLSTLSLVAFTSSAMFATGCALGGYLHLTLFLAVMTMLLLVLCVRAWRRLRRARWDLDQDAPDRAPADRP